MPRPRSECIPYRVLGDDVSRTGKSPESLCNVFSTDCDPCFSNGYVKPAIL